MVTVAEVLALPEVVAGAPRVLAGSSRLGREIRWLHVSEVADIAQLLHGGELILTTGVALPDDPARLERYVADLADAGVAGIVVELGRHFAQIPPQMIAAAERRAMPLVELAREVRYVSITQAVHSRIVNAQFEELERAKDVHEVFTALSLEGATVADIVGVVAERAGCPAVLENLSHQVLAQAGGRSAHVLADWERRSRAVPSPDRTAVGGLERWLVTRVAAQGEPWGRLVLLPDSEPTAHQVLVAERGASALAIERLVERDRESLERQVHRSLLADLIDEPSSSVPELSARSRALGVPLDGRSLVAMVVRFAADGAVTSVAAHAADLRRAEIAARVARRADVAALVGSVRPGQIGLLVACAPGADLTSSLAALARQLRREMAGGGDSRIVVAAGSVVRRPDEARRSLLEALQVASVADPSVTSARGYVSLPDVRVRGLLYLLRGDARLQGFVERELGELLAYEAAHPDARLVAALKSLCDNGGNVAAAARAFGLSRAAYYHRLAQIERTTGVRLDPVESLLSLHLALLAHETIRSSDDGRVTAS